MPRSISVFRMGTSWCIQVDNRQALIDARSLDEAKSIVEKLIRWQPADVPEDPFIHITWDKLANGHHRAVITDG